jgi:drug/metabolite transporter (DMT)-like permease
MSWQILIIAQTILTAASIICSRILARDKQTAKASFVINAGIFSVLYLTALLFTPWLGHVHAHSFSEYWWRFLISGFAISITNVFTYKTLVYFDAGVGSIVSTANSLFTIVGASLVLSEVLTRLQILGSIVLVVGIGYGVLSTRSNSKKTPRSGTKMGLIYALLAGVSYAIGIVNEKSLLGHMTVGSYVVFGIGAQLLMALITVIIIQPKQLHLLLKPRIFGWSALNGVFRGVGGVCFILSEVKSNNVALVSVISNFKLIIVILLSWWLLKERQYLARKFTSATASIIGLTMMFWS